MIFLTCSLFSCKSEDKVTRQLSTYLGKQFGLQLPEARSYFVLVPATRCPACVQFDGSRLSSTALEKTILISDFDHTHFKGFPSYYYDSSSALQRMPVLDYDSKIFVVGKGRVQSVIAVTDLYTQLDSLEKRKL